MPADAVVPSCASRVAACRGCAAAGAATCVIVTVVIPEKLSKAERDLLKQLNEVAAPAVLPKGGGPGLFDRLRDIFS